MLVELSQLVLENGKDVRTWTHALSPQCEDVADLVERETDRLRLEDEAQAIAVRGAVDAVAGCGPRREGKGAGWCPYLKDTEKRRVHRVNPREDPCKERQ